MILTNIAKELKPYFADMRNKKRQRREAGVWRDDQFHTNDSVLLVKFLINIHSFFLDNDSCIPKSRLFEKLCLLRAMSFWESVAE